MPLEKELLIAAKSVAARLYNEHQKLLMDQERLLSECAAFKMAPDLAYWHREHQARKKAEAALRIVEALNDL